MLQDLYNIYASPNYSEAYADPQASCRGDTLGSWVPEPSKQLQVDVFGENGVVAERAWPASCMLTFCSSLSSTYVCTSTITPVPNHH